MVQESSPSQAKPSWTKIFTAFKVALDIKKLLLAAAGIFLVALGWWAISVTFYGLRAFPEWKDYDDNPAERQANWSRFKAKRNSWNLLHELAGSPSDHRPFDAADLTTNLDEYLVLQAWEEAARKLTRPIIVKENTLLVPDFNKDTHFVLSAAKDAEPDLANLAKKQLTVRSLQRFETTTIADKATNFVVIDGVRVQIAEGPYEKLKTYREDARIAEQIDQNVKASLFLVQPKYKPSGKLRVLPWFEERGENPYLIVANTLKTRGEEISGRGQIVNWLFGEQLPVLLEPLVKFLTPVVYLFDDRAGGWERIYLIFILLWTLAVWGFFGGAICRIAAVQVARNERISLREAINFTRERFASYVAAPVFPMALLGIFVLVLMVFGWVEWIPYLGDLFAGLFWPVVLLIGFIMAVVLVGLVGWPLMIATISTEGTDSFDALSRSYSYVYQAPWQYLWYNFLALVYGAALVFFIGLMASLMVFLGKWGVSSAVGPAKSNPESDREPSYLFYYAPTSFGWRDLLISSSQHVEKKAEIAADGRRVVRYEFKPEYEKHIGAVNRFGAFLVSLWIYPLFLLVVGFGYSYFWTSSTIIYFLMRRYVDDTEMDEVHQDDEDLDDPFTKPAPSPPPAAPPPASKPGTLSLNVVEAPPAPPAPMPPDPPAAPPIAADPPPPQAPFAPPENPPPGGHT